MGRATDAKYQQEKNILFSGRGWVRSTGTEVLLQLIKFSMGSPKDYYVLSLSPPASNMGGSHAWGFHWPGLYGKSHQIQNNNEQKN